MKAKIITGSDALALILGSNRELNAEYTHQNIHTNEENRPEPSEMLKAALSMESCPLVLAYSDFTPEEASMFLVPNVAWVSGEVVLQLVSLIPADGCEIEESLREKIERHAMCKATVNSAHSSPVFLFGILPKERQKIMKVDALFHQIGA